MSHSFCIITGGTRPHLLDLVIESIRAQRIPAFEIIVVGKYKSGPGIIYIEAEEAAATGRLSEMRNRGVAVATHENIVILDDDIILSPDWYSGFLSFTADFDIMTAQVRVPDGSRYIDHATAGGPRGNIILSEEEDDDYLYMTGGGGWVMKNYVARSTQWDEDRTYYQEEDVDFSRRCQARGFRISHNHKMLVFHADASYTAIGRIVARRKEGRSQKWVLSAMEGKLSCEILRDVIRQRSVGHFAEAADYLRLAAAKGPQRWFFAALWRITELRLGGRLPGTKWYPEGDPAFAEALAKYSADMAPQGACKAMEV